MKLQNSNIMPPIMYDKSAAAMLSQRVETALGSYFDAFRSFPISSGPRSPRVSNISVSGYVDPEEHFNQLIVSFWVEASTDQAFEFWEAFNSHLEKSMPGFDDETADVIRELISTDVQWTS